MGLSISLYKIEKLPKAALVFLVLCLPFSSGCTEKGKGSGTRLVRPNGSGGSIFDNGDKNQIPPVVVTPTPTPEPEPLALLAACFNVDPTEVEPVVGWVDKTMARASAIALCAKLNLVSYKSGILETQDPVEIDQ